MEIIEQSTKDLLHVTMIYGKAGTGKSTRLSEIISEFEKNKNEYIVLTATHSSLENIYNIVSSKVKVDRNKFKTIYSFFRIDWKENVVRGVEGIPANVIIDEFSLINKHLFKKMLICMWNKILYDTNLYISGDPLQLNAIYEGKEKISFGKIQRMNDLMNAYLKKRMKINEYKYIKMPVIEHMHLSVFGMKIVRNGKKEFLSKNMRSEDNVMKLLSAIYVQKDMKYNYVFVDRDDVVNKLIVENWYFLTARYTIMQSIYDKLSERYCQDGLITIHQDVNFRYGLKRLYLYPGMKIIVCDTSTHRNYKGQPIYYNGEALTFTGNIVNNTLKCIKHIDDDMITKEIYISKILDDKGEEYFPIIPENLMTIHKSQGLSLDNVIICIDELFDVSMLYTAITRSRKNVLFYTECSNGVEQLFKNAFIDEFREMELLMRLM